MKNYIFYLSIIILTFNVKGQYQKDSILKANNVSEIHVTHQRKLNGGRVSPSIKLVDENGFIVKSYTVDSTSYQIFNYDSIKREYSTKDYYKNELVFSSLSYKRGDTMIYEVHKTDTSFKTKRISHKPFRYKTYNDQFELISSTKQTGGTKRIKVTTSFPNSKRQKSIMIAKFNKHNQTITSIQRNRGKDYDGKNYKSTYKTEFFYDSNNLLIKMSTRSSKDNYQLANWKYFEYIKREV